MPETGLLLLPTKPTILEETVAKKNPKITTIIAPIKVTGIAGTSQINKVITKIHGSISFMLKSLAVRELSLTAVPSMPFIASLKVRIIRGRDFIRLIIPPAANAPAPI